MVASVARTPSFIRLGRICGPVSYESRTKLREDKLLEDGRIDDLCIIDIAELEMLEGLAENGHDPVTVLRNWKKSGLADITLRNFVLDSYDTGPHMRPKRMKDGVRATLATIRSSLQLRSDDGSDWPVPGD